MITLTNVSKTYKQARGAVVALDDVSVEIPDGQMVAIQGPTGGGKSTFLQMVGALDRPSMGTVSISDNEISRASDRRLTALRADRIGFVFQTFNLIPTLTALENVETALVPQGVPGEQRRERAMAALTQVGLADRMSHLPSELSGGQQQRVAIARAIVKNPDVLLADEPTGNLDEDMRDEIMDVLVGLWKTLKLTLIIVTHDSTVAKRAQRRLRIAQGKISEAK